MTLGNATFTGNVTGNEGEVGVSFPFINFAGTITAGPNGADTGNNGIVFAMLNYSRALDIGLQSIAEMWTNFSGSLQASQNDTLDGGERFGLSAWASTFTSQPGDLAKSFWIDQGDTAGKNNVSIKPNTNPTILTGVYKKGNGAYYLLANFKLGPNEKFIFGMEGAATGSTLVPEPSSVFLLILGIILTYAIIIPCKCYKQHKNFIEQRKFRGLK